MTASTKSHLQRNTATELLLWTRCDSKFTGEVYRETILDGRKCLFGSCPTSDFTTTLSRTSGWDRCCDTAEVTSVPTSSAFHCSMKAPGPQPRSPRILWLEVSDLLSLFSTSPHSIFPNPSIYIDGEGGWSACHINTGEAQTLPYQHWDAL